MKLWIDDVRPAPEGYHWCKSVNEAKDFITRCENMILKLMDRGHKLFLSRDYEGRSIAYARANDFDIEVIDIDHDAGEYAKDGGDYIKLLDWLEEQRLGYPIRIHSMNPVGVQNMRAIIQKNGWKEVR